MVKGRLCPLDSAPRYASYSVCAGADLRVSRLFCHSGLYKRGPHSDKYFWFGIFSLLLDTPRYSVCLVNGLLNSIFINVSVCTGRAGGSKTGAIR